MGYDGYEGKAATGTLGLINPGIAEKTSTPIRDGISALEETAAYLHKMVSELEERLGTVLTPEAPAQTTGAPTTPPAGSSDVTGRLYTLYLQLGQVGSRVRTLINRTEV